LAADEPQFDNHMQVWRAREVRNAVLAEEE